MAFGVLLITSQLHSTIKQDSRTLTLSVRHVYARHNDSQQSIGKKQPVENVTSIGSTDGVPVSQGRDFLVFYPEDGSTTNHIYSEHVPTTVR